MVKAVEGLVGITEIGQLLGVSRQRAGQIVDAHVDFPMPVAEIAAGRIWRQGDVEAWVSAHPVRKAGVPAGRRLRFLDSLTSDGKAALRVATDQARRMAWAEVGCEHLLFGVAARGSVGASALRIFGVNGADILDELVKGDAPAAKRPLPLATPTVRAMEFALVESLYSGGGEVDTGHILFGLLRDTSNSACEVLISRGVDCAELLAFVATALRAAQPNPKALDPDVRTLHASIDTVAAQLERITSRLEAIEARLADAE